MNELGRRNRVGHLIVVHKEFFITRQMTALLDSMKIESIKGQSDHKSVMLARTIYPLKKRVKHGLKMLALWKHL